MSNSLSKPEIIALVAGKTGLSKADTGSTISELINVIQETLSSGQNVQFVGFGNFEVAIRKERKGINPRTKEEITIPAKKVVKFKAGKGFKDAVHGGGK
jgi:DNA-binding protein HU-beta